MQCVNVRRISQNHLQSCKACNASAKFMGVVKFPNPKGVNMLGPFQLCSDMTATVSCICSRNSRESTMRLCLYWPCQDSWHALCRLRLEKDDLPPCGSKHACAGVNSASAAPQRKITQGPDLVEFAYPACRTREVESRTLRKFCGCDMRKILQCLLHMTQIEFA